MRFVSARGVAGSLTVIPEVTSTNDSLRSLVARREAGGEPTDFTVVVSPNQTAGRGRLGRAWVAPPGASLAISVLIAPVIAQPRTARESAGSLRLEQYGWFPLIAGVAVARAVQSIVPAAKVGIKWPNDVQISGSKVAGILTELVAETGELIVGVGVNLSMTPDQLPTPSATSLAIAGATLTGDELADHFLAEFLTQLRQLTTSFVDHAGDPTTSGIATVVSELCTTIGAEVRAELPGGGVMIGTATGIDSSGRLLLREAASDSPVAVAAGDIIHLRYE